MLTKKEWLMSYALFTYIGGFSYFWAASTNDQYLMIASAFLFSQLIGMRILMIFILRKPFEFKIQRRIIRLAINFAVNVLIGNLLFVVIKTIHLGNIEEFMAGPLVYGCLYGLLYMLYVAISIRTVEEIT